MHLFLIPVNLVFLEVIIDTDAAAPSAATSAAASRETSAQKVATKSKQK